MPAPIFRLLHPWCLTVFVIQVGSATLEAQRTDPTQRPDISAPRAIPVPEAEPVEPLEAREPVEAVVPLTAGPEPGFSGEPLNPDLPVGIQILSPNPRQVVEGGTLDLFIELTNYRLGNPERGGNRVHVILNNRAPRVVYDIARPVTFQNLPAGGHTIRVFAAAPDGTMIRDQTAFAIRHFFMGNKDFQNYVDPSAPYLTVNLPMEGEAGTTADGMIVFDYKLHNAEVQGSYAVRYDLSGGYTGMLSEQGPVFWSNLTPGRHRLRVEFVDSKGRLVPGPFNQIEREFVVKKVLQALPVFGEEEPGTVQVGEGGGIPVAPLDE